MGCDVLRGVLRRVGVLLNVVKDVLKCGLGVIV